MVGFRIGLLLVLFGALVGAPGLLAVGVVVELVWLVRSLWARYGLQRLVYDRRIDATRAVVGEEIGLELTVRNRKVLPLPWLQVDDLVTGEARVAGRPLVTADQPDLAVLRTTWTVGWFERVTRRLQIAAERRGVYHFRLVRLRVADLFAQETAVEERTQPLRYVVVPRTVPVRARNPIGRLPGPARTRFGLFEEPSLFSGVRAYQPGDPLRRVHWKATARLRQPVSRRFDPGHEREVVIAMDVQTVPGAFWLMQYDDALVESLCTAALSLIRSLVGAGVASGLAANGYSERPSRWVYVAPSASPTQVERLADELAAVRRWASMPFPRMLDELGRRATPATTIIALTGRAAPDVLPVLRRLRQSGREVSMMTMGPESEAAASQARSIGIPVTVAELNADWRTADVLRLVG